MVALAVAITLTATTAAGGSAAASADGAATTERVVDLTALPIGDSITDAPEVGGIFSCQTVFNGPGATPGPWLDEDAGTFDLTAKPSVDGSVDWDGEYTISFGASGATRFNTTNDLPDHPTGTFPIASTDDAYQYDRNPNTIRATALNMGVPTRPGLLATPACLSLGSIGIMTSGVALFNALDAQGRDAVAYEIPDTCGGHPQQAGAYHYHALSDCQEDPATGAHSPRLGYARDGFGIYGRYGENGATLTNADLDECHGHAHEIEWDGVVRVMYHYHATWEYPYTLGCYRGTTLATAPVDCNLAPPDNDFTDVATTASYVDAVDWAACHELVTGTTFRPTAGLTRKQAVVLLWRFMGQPEAGGTSSYPDVADEATWHPALDWAAQEGLFTTGPTGAFQPAKTLTRSQWATWLWHLMGDPAGDPDVTLTDVPGAAGYHDALDWAVAHDVLAPSAAGRVRPTSTIQRSRSISWLSALAASTEAWADHGGDRPDTLRQL